MFVEVNGFSFLIDDEGDGVDIMFECIGKEVCMYIVLYVIKVGGKVIMVGMGMLI